MARLKPLPRSERFIQYGGVENRGRIKKRSNDTVKNVEVGLLDVDAAIMYYFNNVIKPTVMEQGEEVKVPLMYANPERWASIRKSGFMRDSKRQIITPVIVFRRSSMAKSTELAVDKLDANDPKLFYSFEKKYSQQNRYNRFSTDRGLNTQREFYNVAMPDYVTLNYECMIWTSYIEQMNKIIEKINWSDGSYWGDPGKLKFRVNIESFEDSTEMSEGERFIKTTFSIQLYGYLVPESFNDKMNTQKYITPKKVNIVDETDMSISSIYNPTTKAETVRVLKQGGKSIKGGTPGATDFIRGTKNAAGQEIQDLEFTNIYAGDTMFVMRVSGAPTSSRDTKAVINKEYGDQFYQKSLVYVSGSQTESSGLSQVYDLQHGLTPFTASFKVLTGSVDVQFNGQGLVSNNNQLNDANPADFYLSGSYNEWLTIKSPGDSNLAPGVDMRTADGLSITFQRTVNN